MVFYIIICILSFLNENDFKGTNKWYIIEIKYDNTMFDVILIIYLIYLKNSFT